MPPDVLDELRGSVSAVLCTVIFAALRVELVALCFSLLAAVLAAAALWRAGRTDRALRDWVDAQAREVDQLAAGMDPPSRPDD